MTPLPPDVIEKIMEAIKSKSISFHDSYIQIYESDLRTALESVEVGQAIKHRYGPTDGLPIELTPTPNNQE
jgi:hypothetical protein